MTCLCSHPLFSLLLTVVCVHYDLCRCISEVFSPSDTLLPRTPWATQFARHVQPLPASESSLSFFTTCLLPYVRQNNNQICSLLLQLHFPGCWGIFRKRNVIVFIVACQLSDKTDKITFCILILNCFSIQCKHAILLSISIISRD